MKQEKTLLESCQGNDNLSVKAIDVLPNLETSTSEKHRSGSLNSGFGRSYGQERRFSELGGSGRHSRRSISQFGENQFGEKQFGERFEGRQFERKKFDRPESVPRWRRSWE